MYAGCSLMSIASGTKEPNFDKLFSVKDKLI